MTTSSRPSCLNPPSQTRNSAIDTRSAQRARAGAAILAAAVVLWWGGRRLAPEFLAALASISGLGRAAPAVFVIAYAVAVVALVPASPLTIIGGALFGLMRGVLYSLSGALLGATTAFLLGRHVVRRVVERRLTAMPRFAAIDRAASAQGLRIVFLLRLSPVVPFNVLNYALGLTKISLGDFVLASVGMLPGAMVYAYCGKVTGEALALAGQAEVAKDASYYAVLLAGLVATVAATTIVTRTARQALRDV